MEEKDQKILCAVAKIMNTIKTEFPEECKSSTEKAVLISKITIIMNNL